MNFKNVVVINSYAGSLTIAATRGGYNILASLEDGGYGLDAQRANFPNLTYVDDLPWPEANLTGMMVIAHPPCAAFSMQNNSTNKGVASTHFDCTRRVIDYACLHNAAAVLIESVPGALEGARGFYDTYPQQYGYDVYRIMQNAITFGVPQWRPRYWSVLIKRSALKHSSDMLILKHTREYRTIGERLGEGIKGALVPWLERKWTRQLQYMKDGGMWSSQVTAVSNGEWGYGPLVKLLASHYGLTREESQERFHISNYQADGFKVLDPDGHTGTLMWDSAWLWQGRPCTVPEYNVLAGFPAGYQFPKLRMQGSYLSKGVAPPVARWLLDEVSANLAGILNTCCDGAKHQYIIKPGEMADLRIKKAQALQRDLFTK